MTLGMFPPKQKLSVSFAPTDISGLVGWWDAGQGVTISTGVSAWADQSGNGRNLSQATGSAQPSYSASDASFSNRPSISFDGSDDILSKTGLSLSVPMHYFLVFVQDTWTDNDIILNFGSSNFEWTQHAGSSPQVAIRQGESWTCTVSPTLSTTYLAQVYLNGTSGYVGLNDGSSVNTGVQSYSETISEFSIGGSSAKGNQKSDIRVAELAVYSAEITGADLTSLRTYFNDKYSIY